MILDTSCLAAIVFDEPERAPFLELSLAARCQMSVATWLESCLVIDSRAPRKSLGLDALLERMEVELVPVSVHQGEIARRAHQRFGRGSGSPARLNFGDCFAYALAIDTGEPLLFKGDDFRHTDVRPAI